MSMDKTTRGPRAPSPFAAIAGRDIFDDPWRVIAFPDGDRTVLYSMSPISGEDIARLDGFDNAVFMAALQVGIFTGFRMH